MESRTKFLQDIITRLNKLSGGEMQYVLQAVGIDANLTVVDTDNQISNDVIDAQQDWELDRRGGKTPK